MNAAREPWEPTGSPRDMTPAPDASPAGGPGQPPLEFPVADSRPAAEGEHVIELKEEQLVARKRLVEAGEVVIHTEVDEVPGRLEVDAFHEEIEIEHVPVGKVVTERVAPWEED